MLSIPGQPLLDKNRLVGRCVRLAVAVDIARIQAEVTALPAHHWGTRGGRVGVHNPAQAVFLRGHAPAAGEMPIDDREPLDALPAVRELIESIVPAPPMRCLLAMLPAGAVIAPHVDSGDYFLQTIRIHVPIFTHPQTWMFCAGLSYHMAAGEVWALNNATVHGVWNADAERSRTHLICDFLPTRALVDLLVHGERELGREEPAVDARLLAARAALAQGA